MTGLKGLDRVCVTPSGYGVGMRKNTTPNTQSAQAIVNWFAEAGLTVEVVDHCSDAACARCGSSRLDRAA